MTPSTNGPLRVGIGGPSGGGGLAAGIALAFPDTDVVPIEPEGWDDVCRSIEAGTIQRVVANPPPTACDALQTLATLIFDGVFDRFPRLKWGAIELGAGGSPGGLAIFAEHLQATGPSTTLPSLSQRRPESSCVRSMGTTVTL